jgi:hypothetical protein
MNTNRNRVAVSKFMFEVTEVLAHMARRWVARRD